ncbi:MAG: T9SS type A sorting domain-containing protein [Cyclobacteriaceae bacterium]|nr:T9SS type A sorting domain-containing protein [Cyclobacteriaceae bacterium]
MKKIIVLIIVTALPFITNASHLRCGYISVKRLSSTNLTCTITLTVFVNSGSGVAFGNGHLNFGDGSTHVLIPENSIVARPDLGTNIGMATFTINHSYAGPGQYKISYIEASRNAGILNVDNSISTPFITETTINLDPFLGKYDTPDFLIEPYFVAKLGSTLSLSIGGYSNEDLVVSYQLSVPSGISTNNYHLPENFKVNPHNGLITWDTKYLDGYYAGEYLFAVKIHLSKYIDGNLYRLCTMLRDFQIILVDDEPGGMISDNVNLDENNRIYLSEGNSKTIKIFYEPNLSENTSISAYTTLSENADVFSFSTYDSTETDIKVGILTLAPNSTIARDNPYIISIRGAHNIESNTMFASDIVYMFYTRDLYPEIITRTEDTLEGVTVAPNPVTDFLKIQLTQPQSIQLTLLDQSGKIVLKNIITESSIIDMREFLNGLYLVEVRTSRGRRVTKVIKH